LTKQAMLTLYKEMGVVPHLQVHDELDLSYKDNNGKPLQQIIDIMENCVQLEVPLKVSVEKGRSWGEVK